jgi:hypothetical protein
VLAQRAEGVLVEAEATAAVQEDDRRPAPELRVMQGAASDLRHCLAHGHAVMLAATLYNTQS